MNLSNEQTKPNTTQLNRFADALSGLLTPFFQQMIEEVTQGVINSMAERERERANSAEFLTRNEVIEKLHISAPTFYNLVNRGVLNPQYVGRKVLISAVEFDTLLANGKLNKYVRNGRQ